MILDVGCGAFPRGDVNLDLYLKSDEHHVGYRLKDCLPIPNFVRADICAPFLPFKDNAFNESIAYAVLEHLESPMKLIKELIRVTRGLIKITVPHRYYSPYKKVKVHRSFFSVRWFERAFRGYPLKTRIETKRPLSFPFLMLPYLIHVTVSTFGKSTSVSLDRRESDHKSK